MNTIGDILHSLTQNPPVGSLFLRGQTLKVSRNPALFQLFGYSYGGALTEFDLPNLASNAPTMCLVVTGRKPVINSNSLVGNPIIIEDAIAGTPK